MPNTPKQLIVAETAITGHANADFDCLSAIVAAGKLYPNSVLINPGFQEKTVPHIQLSIGYLYNFRQLKDVDLSGVKRLVVVDTRQRARLGHVQPLLDRPDIEIHAYDHHPGEDDLSASHVEVLIWGSTTAILVKKIIERGIAISQDEANIFGLGLYEDTGCFTYPSTTSHDMEAAAWLLSQGLDLNLISELITRDITAQQIQLLNAMLEAAVTHVINGVEVTMTEVVSDEYVADFSVLAQRMMEVQNIRALFCIGLMEDRIHLVARSRIEDVDVGVICASFGGGGHSYAASATIKDRTLSQVKDELFALLYSHINKQVLVRDLMTNQPRTVYNDETLAHAAEVMVHFGLKAVPVLDRQTERCVGILEHQLADKAIGHGLGEERSEEYMVQNIVTIPPDQNLYQVMEIILGRRQRLVPIVENDRVIAVLTRTDLINTLVQEQSRIPENLFGEKKVRNIAKILNDRLPTEVLDLLRKIGDKASAMKLEAYAVGGFVRDVFLSRDNQDIDVVVEGDGVAFAEAFAKDCGARVRSHPKFKTAVVIFPDGRKIDMATARLEYYAYPAALPTVELSSIKMDLARRDFTINALAVQLNPGRFGQLVDFFNAQRDMKEKTIRVLHSLSFIEDPTRILRAVRFEQRFKFRIGNQAERLIKNALHHEMFDRVSGARVLGELKLICAENDPPSCLRRLDKLGVMTAIHPLLKLDPMRENILDELHSLLDWYRRSYLEPQAKPWNVYFLGLCSGYTDAQVETVARRFNFSKKEAFEFSHMREGIKRAVSETYYWMKEQGSASQLHFILNELPTEAVLYLIARSHRENMRKHYSHYLTELRRMQIKINGDDLMKLGLPPGPLYAAVFRKILAAMIDGQAPDRAAQMEIARELVRGLV